MIPRRIGSIGSLGLALLHRWEPETIFVIITAYLDESGTHTSSPHMTLGGWVGTWGQWEGFDPKWRALLNKNKLEYFHSKDFRAGVDPYRGWDGRKKFDFMKCAADIAKRHMLFGFTILLIKEEYHRFYRDGHTSQQLPLDSEYGVCFRACLSTVPYLVLDALKDRKNKDLYFVLESGGFSTGAPPIFDAAKRQGPPEVADLLHTLSLGCKKKYPGLQVSDISANNAWHYEADKKLTPMGIPAGDVWNEARKISKSPIFRIHVGEDMLTQFKGFVLAKHGKRLANRLTAFLPSNTTLASP